MKSEDRQEKEMLNKSIFNGLDGTWGFKIGRYRVRENFREKEMKR